MMETSQKPVYFVCRLLAPRPTFPLDMTEEERAMMGEHAAYWSERMAEGKVVVFGPVMDPKGAWGLAVLRVRDEAEVQALTDADPAISSQRGFGYERLPMMMAVLPS